MKVSLHDLELNTFRLTNADLQQVMMAQQLLASLGSGSDDMIDGGFFGSGYEYAGVPFDCGRVSGKRKFTAALQQQVRICKSK